MLRMANLHENYPYRLPVSAEQTVRVHPRYFAVVLFYLLGINKFLIAHDNDGYRFTLDFLIVEILNLLEIQIIDLGHVHFRGVVGITQHLPVGKALALHPKVGFGC